MGKIQTSLFLSLVATCGLSAQMVEVRNDKETPGTTVEVLAGMRVEVQPQLRTDIIATETLKTMDLIKSNATSLVEAVEGKAGICVQTECSLCNARNVVLNQLPGRFTTIMIDGIPIFSSVSATYGLDMVGVAGLESIEVSRGAGVSLVAPEALAGTVNLITRRPQKREGVFEVQGGNFDIKRLEALYAQPFNKAMMTFSFSANDHGYVDGNDNLISEYSGLKKRLGGLSFWLDDVAQFEVQGRLDVVHEKRGGGALGFDHDAMKQDLTGNPFAWNKGKGASPDVRGWIRPDGDFDAAVSEGLNPILLPDNRVLLRYDGGRGGFAEHINTTRSQFVTTAKRDLDDHRKLKLSLGAARHDQDSFYEGDIYNARQHQFYLKGSLEHFLGATLLTTGLNYRFEDLKSEGQLATGPHVKGLDNYAYKTPAAFVQVYHAFWGGDLELNASLRHDHNNIFKGITTPRASLMLHHAPHCNSRLAFGRGFRFPTSFFEQDHGILSTTRIVREVEKPEKSDNLSYTFSWGGSKFAAVLSATYNRIHDFALLDSGATDAVTGDPITLFTQCDKPLTIKGLDGTFTYRFAKGLEGTLGLERYLYDFEPGTLPFARPENRAHVRLDFDRGPINVMARGTWTESMDLKRFYDYENNQRFNLDGSTKRDRSLAFWAVDISATYKIQRFSILLSVHNLLDFKQTDHEDFLWVDASGAMDVTQVWGPNRGRMMQLGVRYAF